MFAPLFLASVLSYGVVAVIVVLLIILVVSNVIIVPQACAYVIERLGAYQQTWQTGLHFKIPLIDRVANKVTLKERIADFKPQPVITRDNVKLYTYGVVQPMSAIENLTATTLRNLIGELELDQTLTSRDIINSKMRAILDEATDPWGIKVNRVELKNIIPPREIQDAMERQMKAERERREAILKAEGEKKSAILIAEGEKESAILRAEAVKQQKIKEAEGQAEALMKVQSALADSIKLLNEADASDAVIRLKALEAFQAAANGQATKIIIPSELHGLAGLATGVVETVKGQQ